MTKKHPLFVAILSIIAPVAYADDDLPATDFDSKLPSVVLPTEQVVSTTQGTAGVFMSTSPSDIRINKDVLKQRGVNLGDALAGELGVHANQFGGGASAPVIRGQEGKRIKILSHGSETLDMSFMSPDHAVTVDSVLAHQVQVVRGVETLRYSSGNSAGVVNVADDKIPTQLPERASAELGLRFDTASQEKLVSLSAQSAVGQHIAIHAQGLNRDAKDYRTPTYEYQNQTLKRLKDSFSDAKSGSLGASWIGDDGYVGVAYSERQDKYGLPAHTHLYEKYYLDIIPIEKTWPDQKPYLKHYPFLMEETDINYNNPGIQCITKGYHSHGNLCDDEHNHGHNYNYDTDSSQDESQHEHGSPHIDLRTKRWDIRGQWRANALGIQDISLNAGFVRYRHDEKTDSVVDNAFKNQGKNWRLELTHLPMSVGAGKLTGVFGGQYLTQSSHALDNKTQNHRRQHLLQDHTASQKSLFWVEQLAFDKWQLNFGSRLEKQKIQMAFNQDLGKFQNEDAPDELKQPHQATAHSYAASLSFEPTAKHRFSLIWSHQERLPNAQELYAHGKHLATNTFDTGNKNLSKERSNNIEFGYALTGDKWDGKFATYYNDFDNYIYLATLNNAICYPKLGRRCSRALNDKYSLRLNRYNQSRAKIYGIEAKIGYQFNKTYHASVFGDYVRGKLFDLPALPTGYKYRSDEVLGYRTQPDGDAPRIPAARLGLRGTATWNNGITASAEVVHTFDQNHVAILENPTKGHTLLNAGLHYDGVAGRYPYSAFINGYNLTNAKVYNHASFLSYIPQMGRSVNFGINWQF
ncbi:TonB-dependent receptor [Moraxella sp. ZJ142]|uniref:TonB-dependent receptor n=1 Tax=Moraxella marmotae TaxID=3344520 RepID=UPI0035D50509